MQIYSVGVSTFAAAPAESPLPIDVKFTAALDVLFVDNEGFRVLPTDAKCLVVRFGIRTRPE